MLRRHPPIVSGLLSTKLVCPYQNSQEVIKSLARRICTLQIAPQIPADSLKQPLYTLTTNSRVAPPMTISDGLLSQKAQQQHLNYSVTEVISQPVMVLKVCKGVEHAETVQINILCLHERCSIIIGSAEHRSCSVFSCSKIARHNKYISPCIPQNR